ncbi:MAG: cation-translocating P-type ATPase, partial [Nanoarchaeota archaeon]
VGFIVLLSFFEEYKATRDMESLKKLTPHRTRVIRNGEERIIDARMIVPGDILHLNRGDIVPADARIVTCTDLKVDESALTGESVPVTKSEKIIVDSVTLADRINMVFAGTMITNGHAKVIIVETGVTTELGKIASLVENAKEEKSPLQKKLDVLSSRFGLIVVSVCVLIFVIGLLRSGGAGLDALLVLAIAVAVAGIPESLPAVISISLAIGMKRMARNNAIIKKLSAVETLGTCTVICSDKTGTLTQNKMVVEHIWNLSKHIDVTGEGFDPHGGFFSDGKKVNPLRDRDLNKLLEIGMLCNDSDLHNMKSSWQITGEATEASLVVLGQKAGLSKKWLHEQHPRLAERAFNSDRKYMTCINKMRSGMVLHAKGAPEKILSRCSAYLLDGKCQKLTASVRDAILTKQSEFARQGYRVIALAFRDMKQQRVSKKYAEKNLVFAGMAAIRDPPEPSATDAIRKCHNAGIRTVMITGDNPLTAQAVAEEIGILTPGMKVVTGQEIDQINDHELRHLVPSVAVFARVAPSHKLRIVKALQDDGEIVAMTGDGVNDAPALKRADIGIAMGREGTDVARDASEMILKDDNFSTIVYAIEEGRNIYNNIIRFLYYLLPGNLSQISIILISTIAGVLPPITPLMILFLNLVTSDFPALGLAVEKTNSNVMRQKPRSPKEQILNGYLTLKIGQVIPIIVLGSIGLFMWEMFVQHADFKTAQTVVFVSIILFMLFHGFNAKAIDGSIFSKHIFSNIFFYAGFAVSIVATFLVLYVPAIAAVFGTVPLTLQQWVPIIFVSSIVVVYTEIIKTIINSEIEESLRLKMPAKEYEA